MSLFTRLLVLTLTLFGCAQESRAPQYRVGVDPQWYPLQLGARATAVTTFSTELLTDIGKQQKIPFAKVTVSWDNLLLGLQKWKYEAILSSMPPYLFNQKLFSFSDVYLALGPVLVVPQQAPINAVSQLQGKIVGVIAGSGDGVLVEKVPDLLVREYESVPVLLQALVQQTIDAALVDQLSATAYCRDLYQGQLKVATAPLNDHGLRLITLYGKSPDMLKAFNEGLKALKASKQYEALLEKWSLN